MAWKKTVFGDKKLYIDKWSQIMIQRRKEIDQETHTWIQLHNSGSFIREGCCIKVREVSEIPGIPKSWIHEIICNKLSQSFCPLGEKCSKKLIKCIFHFKILFDINRRGILSLKASLLEIKLSPEIAYSHKKEMARANYMKELGFCTTVQDSTQNKSNQTMVDIAELEGPGLAPSDFPLWKWSKEIFGRKTICTSGGIETHSWTTSSNLTSY